MKSLILLPSTPGTASSTRLPRDQQKRATLILGAPCSGKGTATSVILPYGARHYSSSKVLIGHAKLHGRDDVLKEIKNGELAPFGMVELVLGWEIQDFLAYYPFGVFDGWGRVPKELWGMIRRLKKHHVTIDILFLQATEECLLERARARNRNDDAAIRRRIEIFNQNKTGLLEVVSGEIPSQNFHPVEVDDLNQDELKTTVEQRLGLIQETEEDQAAA